jgi:hypothetical protein
VAEGRPRPQRRPREDAEDQNDSNDTSDQEEEQDDGSPEEPEEPEAPEDPSEIAKSDGTDDSGEDETSDGKDEDTEVERHPQSMQVDRDANSRTDTTATLEPLTDASPEQWLGSNQDPDVLLAIPNLGIDHIGITVDNIRAHVELHAKVLDLLELHVGAQASIEKVDIQIENVRVQAMLKVRLDEVTKIVGRVMDTIDKNPEILTNLTGGLGKGLEKGLSGGTSGSDDDSDGKGGTELASPDEGHDEESDEPQKRPQRRPAEDEEDAQK